MSVSSKNLLSFYDLYNLLVSPHLTTICFTLEEIYKYRFLVPFHTEAESLELLPPTGFVPLVWSPGPLSPRQELQTWGSSAHQPWQAQITDDGQNDNSTGCDKIAKGTFRQLGATWGRGCQRSEAGPVPSSPQPPG